MSKNKPDIVFKQRVADAKFQSDESNLHPLLQRIFSARGLSSYTETRYSLAKLLSPDQITQLSDAAKLLAQHIHQQSSIMILGDYDADGATSTALCVRALNMLGHNEASFLLPDRVSDGYGVSANVAQRVIDLAPQLVITVDTGIASFKGLGMLKQAGIDVIITDHHLPAEELPDANVIVDPNAFAQSAGKNLAGVGVAFYLMLATRGALRESGYFENKTEPNLAECLDLVAIGTVADLVPLDYNNRILVTEGLKRIRAGACSKAISKLIQLTGRTQKFLTSQDIAFTLAPRINAAGRLDDMSIGVQALLSQDEATAAALAFELDSINSYRRELQGEMTQQAMQMLPDIDKHSMENTQFSHVLYEESWHEGIVGIIASKIKDMTFRPSISFAKSEEGALKGSGRSIPGVHMRDMLDLVDKQSPGIIRRFGGHAMAAGLTIEKESLEIFKQSFEQVLKQQIDPACFDNVVYYDDEISAADINLEMALTLRESGPWGQRFPTPSFIGEFRVLNQRILSDRHLKLILKREGQSDPVDAILFYATDKELKTNYQTIKIHYELSVNIYRELESVQLMIRHII